MTTPEITGTTAAGFEPVAEAFAANFAEHGEVGAGVAVYVEGRCVVDLTAGVADQATGRPYDADTLQLVFSTTKGIVAIVAHQLAQEGRLDLDAPVAAAWPEFAAGGKEAVTTRQLLSHRAGLPFVEEHLSMEEFLAWEPVTKRLAAQAPAWEPGTAHGYHAITYGFLVGEVLRRVTGQSVGELVAERIAGPLDVQLTVGTPPALHPRVAPLLDPPLELGPDLDPFILAILDADSMTHKAFANPPVLPSSFNAPEVLEAEIPAANGVTNARSLAKVYAATIGEVDGVRLLSDAQVDDARAPQSEGADLVLVPDVNRIASGFFLPYERAPFSGGGSFGHTGLGGSVGFADPERGLAFGYVMNQARTFPIDDPRTTGLIEAALGAIGA